MSYGLLISYLGEAIKDSP